MKISTIEQEFIEKLEKLAEDLNRNPEIESAFWYMYVLRGKPIEPVSDYTFHIWELKGNYSTIYYCKEHSAIECWRKVIGVVKKHNLIKEK